MADLSLLQEDLQEEIEGFGVDDYSSESDVIIIPSALDFVSQDEMLTPLGRLDKYASSENVFNRQMVARSLLDTLKEVSDDERDCIAVLERVSRLADDSEPTVRAELMEQVPHIALFCQENRPSIPYAFSKYLLPIVVRYLADQNNQVRKTSQAALLTLLEQELIDRFDVEAKVCPVLIDLTAPDSNDDVKTEAVAIMCKMAPMVGKDITERLILPRFCEMCCDCRMFHVRKVCAANFGDICSVVGQQATEEMLLPRFFQLCSDNVWGVRKACAECFMAVSCATSQEIRRTKLSTLFINLISDPSRWVRQAAFQSLGPFISTFANPSSSGQYFKEENKNSEDIVLEEKNSETIRDGDNFSENVQFRTEDIPLDVCLCKSNLRLENNLEDHTQTCRKSLSESHIHLDRSLHSTLSSVSLHSILQEAVDELEQGSPNLNTTLLPEMDISSPEPSLIDQELFNSFHFWRTPLPEIDLDLELELEQITEKTFNPESPEGGPEITIPDSPNITMATRKELEEMIENLEPHIDDPDVKAILREKEGSKKGLLPGMDGTLIIDPKEAQVEVLSAALRATSMDTQEEKMVNLDREDDLQDEILIKELQNCKINQDDPVPLINDNVENMDSTLHYIHNDSDLSTDNSFSPEEERKSKVQDVVPQALLDQYLSMTDPSRAQTVDTEIAKHCAYSLPGVALTLGRQNWHCLRETYETLASDMQWKVRRTLAFSIHELAIILGDQLTAADLVPIFNGFLKDLDEVRIGVLKHLHDFLKLLHIDKRREYLYQLQEFLVTDNSRNWRFRAELAEQLILLLDLYSPRDVYDYLRPIALNLCADKVSSVRWISYKLVSEMVKKLHMATPSTFGVDLINELVENFGRCPKWSGRQTFVFVCQTIIEDDCLPLDQFAVHLMPHLLNLANDSVPNVRVLLAKTLRQTLLEKDYFLSSANSHQEAVEQTIMALQMDSDSDVKYFASIHPSSNKIAEDAMSTASSTY
ncbi:serine/threonine-protein phosphatase 4 regulatory subunit 1 isoform X2 [Sarcophilus harrisii]|uniref:Serine/threonine-protein phosphatase 4 regulatory subunit 1 n=1 Tax=Sarcophilus harrisii TaxID=9305 RepID=A0A7N4P431_SARHA|nr:serine/threonine-protein phosphatase 4 regulatory subunit 1 isoform X2 [Sarcophilus harrisii]XP_031802500.1 serine/threonine-protein phosphatase 4 regulatory subunit 1 isoform X2 [Sarcophilus harrisii]